MTDTNDTVPKTSDTNNESTNNPSIELIRQRIAKLYSNEPSVKEEQQEIIKNGAVSAHQEYLKELLQSGKNQSQIQNDWHNYYQGLNDADKKQVWREFYENHSHTIKKINSQKNHHISSHHINKKNMGSSRSDSVYELPKIKDNIISTINKRSKVSRKHNFQSVIFGLGLGVLVLFIFMFGFFNERFIAPFITPSKNTSATPIITDAHVETTVDLADKIIIPKINVEIPVVYNVNSIEEKAIQSGLENGAVHYPISPEPGQLGNSVIIGHSANNIFNNGKYKYAFALLNKLQEGDTFILTHGGKRYLFKIYIRKVVKPSDVSVLGPTDKPATATLITCDPPGTSLHRLILVGEQISPSLDKDIASKPAATNASTPNIIPGNAPSLFQRLFGWL